MSKFIHSISILICLLALPLSTSTAQSLNHKQGELLIQLKPDQNIESVLEDWQSRHFQAEVLTAKPLVRALNIWQVNFDFTKHKEGDVKSLIWKDDRVEQVQYNHFITTRATPNDPLYEEQWHHLNVLLNGSPDADLDSDLAWDISTGGLTPQGDTIVLAVIDNGIDLDHPDLQDRIWINHNEIPDNGVDDDMNGYVDDYLGYNTNEENGNIAGGEGHGTSVAGIIGATGNNAIGVTGINWDSRLMIIRNNFNTTEANVLIAYGYAYAMRRKYNLNAGQKGAFVVATNSSWGRDFGHAEDAPLWCSFYDELGEVGIVNCAATANASIDVDRNGDLPTSCTSNYLVSVTNLNQFGEKLANAGFGVNSIDLGAFGDGVFTTSDSGYGAFGGTSAACPNVTGLIGLLYAAPCDNLTAIAKSNPKEAANFVVDYILEGTKANASLQNITQSGGQLNLNNSLTDMMNDCFECSLPTSVNDLALGQNTGSFTWTAFNSSLAVNLQYRKVGDSIFNTVLNVMPPFELTGLAPCTAYDYQLESICGDTTSNFTSMAQFSTSGCCENPTDLMLVSQEETEVFIAWEKAALVDEYSARYKQVGEEIWIPLDNVQDGFVSISGLSPCTGYELQLKANCSQSEVLDYTSSFVFSTTGCGNCVEGNYCQVKGASTASEWIDQIIVDDIEINSGDNNGFVIHDNFDINFAAGGDYRFVINPGFANQALPEMIHVWIDFNLNSAFEEEERLLSSPIIRGKWESRLKIPLGMSGDTRMRVSMFWVENEDAPDSVLPCEEILFGEVEDICIDIIDSQEFCADTVSQVELLSSDMSSAILRWADVNNASEYQVFYRALGAPEFTSFYARQNQVIINGLETCLRYEVQVSALCNGFATESSESFFFDTECMPLGTQSSELAKEVVIYPNPFQDQISIQYEEPFDVEVIQLFAVSGTEVKLTDIDIHSGQIQLGKLDGLAPGLYMLKLEGALGSVVFKVLKG